MQIKKTIANADLPDFLRQSFKIKKVFTEWNNTTGFLETLRVRPKFDGTESDAERNEKIRKQFNENIDTALENALEKNALLTAELMALCCFVAKEDIKNYTAFDFIKPVVEMLKSEDVRDFFTSLL